MYLLIYVFNLIPVKTSSHATRNVDGIPLIKIKLSFFKNTFFPSPIIEWNKPGPTIWNVESFRIFKSNILKFIRQTSRSSFSCYNHKRIQLMTRLCLGLSNLREHKFSHNSQNCINPLSLLSCGMDIESTSHFFLHFPLFNDKRITFVSILNKTDCKLIETNESSLIETLLFGNSLFDSKNTPLFWMHLLITFTERFEEALL